MASPMLSPHAIVGPHLMQKLSSRGITQQQHSLDQMESLFSPARLWLHLNQWQMLKVSYIFLNCLSLIDNLFYFGFLVTRRASPGALAVPSSVAVGAQGRGGPNVRMMIAGQKAIKCYSADATKGQQ